MKRLYNFCAGPAALPEAVLLQAQTELLDWKNHGLSVMEMSHRSAEFIEIAQQAEQNLRAILNVPENYHVLFLQGGARTQFATIPMNILQNKTRAAYVDSGHWSKHAINQAKAYCDVDVIAKIEENGLIADPKDWMVDESFAYLHYVANETIDGVEFHDSPSVAKIPLVSDMSSTLLSRPLDVSQFGLVYAGAQKNIGPAGLTIVIIRDDLIGHALPVTPKTFDYKVQVQAKSMYNTPPTFAWYLAGLVFQWIIDQGGLEKMAEINRCKAEKLYAAIDQSDFYENTVPEKLRSWMNVPFSLPQHDFLSQEFLTQAKQSGLLNLKGHVAVGGMRASLYNAVTDLAVDALIDFMQEFEKRYG